MKKFVSENKTFIIPYLSAILIISFILLKYDKISIHIFINSRHSPLLDFFFKYWTYLGDGIFAVTFVVFMLFVKYRRALISAISLILTGITVQILKHTIFSENLRPMMYFKTHYSGTYKLHAVAGAEPANFFSFPSGHTATAFAIFFLSAITVKNKYLKFIFFIFALLVGYSRIYLSWHFLGDTLAGSVTGFTISFLTSYLLSERYKNTKLDKSIIKT